MTTTSSRRRRHRQQPTAVVRAHLERLLAAGMTRQAITADAGVCDRTLANLLTCTHAHVKGGTAAALFSTEPRLAAESGLVPALGTIRRVRALIAFGYAVTDLAGRSGVSRRCLWTLADEGQDRVDVTTRNRVAAVFERLSATPGPSDDARKLGRLRQWDMPAAWDDIDNPDEQPAPPRLPDPRTLVNRVLAGQAHINLLTARQETSLWRRWTDEQETAGLPVSARQFASQFRISQRRAARIIAAASTHAAPSRTNRKVA